MQLALKQVSPGLTVRPCASAALQFGVEAMGQLVPLLPNPCSPISSTRWQTEDLDGNKVLFQVRAPASPRFPASTWRGSKLKCAARFISARKYAVAVVFHSSGGKTLSRGPPGPSWNRNRRYISKDLPTWSP